MKSLNSSEIDYMFTGAFAASYYGVPRTTADVDIVVQVSRKNADKLIEALRKAQIQMNKRKIAQAIDSDYRIITVEDGKTALRLDIIFSETKLKKKPGTIMGLHSFYQTPEELVLAKLRMIKVTLPAERALKDKNDVNAILEHTRIDVEAVEKQAKKESTLYIFQELQKERTKK